MLMRTDPFRDLDRFAQAMMGTRAPVVVKSNETRPA